jgi:hypothetical protein
MVGGKGVEGWGVEVGGFGGEVGGVGERDCGIKFNIGDP